MKNFGRGKVIDIAQIKVACSRCSVRQLCLPVGITNADMERLDLIVKHRRPMNRGSHVFRQGDAFYALYAIRSGFIKTYVITEDGSEQITGFHLPGEIIGLDAIDNEQHLCAAKVLETTSLCEIPFHRLEGITASVPGLGRRLIRLMSRELQADNDLLTLLGKKSAEARLATLLLSLSARFKRRGFSSREFYLSMSRNDIGNYLGLAVETVSRTFSRFQQQGIVSVQRKDIRLQDMQQLKIIAGISGPHKAPHARGGN